MIIAIGLSVAMAGAWVIERTTGLSGWIDTTWSLAVRAGSIAAAIFADGSISRRSIALLLVALWSLRLASHIGARTRGAKEDPCYANSSRKGAIARHGGSSCSRRCKQSPPSFLSWPSIWQQPMAKISFALWISLPLRSVLLPWGARRLRFYRATICGDLAPPIRDIRNSSAD